MRNQAGQATLEWVGLVLMAGLALGALGLFWAGPDGREAAREADLGEALAIRMTCATRGSCAAGVAPGEGASAPAAPYGDSRLAAPHHAPAVAAPPAGASLGARRAAAPERPAAPRNVVPSLPERTKAFRSLRGLGLIAKRTWILCLGHKRWRYEVEHPRVPTEPFPVDEALRIANGCLNPLAFLGE